METPTEKPWPVFAYTDHNEHKLVLALRAPSIKEADEAYARRTGTHPSKHQHVGCAVTQT